MRIVGAQTTVYVYDAFGALAAAYSNGGMGTPPCHTCYSTYDHLGTTRMITDANANVIARHDFLPFGEEIPGGIAGRRASQFGPGLDNVNQKFTGQERDSESGLDFFQARYFGGALGRFLSPDPRNAGADPGNPQSWNAYSYALNRPTVLIDPSGLRDRPVKEAPSSSGSSLDIDHYGDPGGGSAGGCYIDGAAADCGLTSGLGLDAAVPCPPGGCDPHHDPVTGEWSFFKTYADGSSGYLPDSLAGLSPAEIASAMSIVKAAVPNEQNPIDPKTLTDNPDKIYKALTADGSGISPDQIRIYADSNGQLSIVLSQDASMLCSSNCRIAGSNRWMRCIRGIRTAREIRTRKILYTASGSIRGLQRTLAFPVFLCSCTSTPPIRTAG